MVIPCSALEEAENLFWEWLPGILQRFNCATDKCRAWESPLSLCPFTILPLPLLGRGVWALGSTPLAHTPQLGCRRDWLLYLCRDKTGRSREAGGGKDYALCLRMGCSCPPTPPQSYPHPGFQSGLRRLASLGGAFISIFRTGCSCHGTWLISG